MPGRKHRVVVVGASIAGLTVAETLRSGGYDGELVLIGEETHDPYARPPLSKQVLEGEWEPRRATLRTREQLDSLSVQLRRGTRAHGLDLRERAVQVEGSFTGSETVGFDALVLATGLTARIPDVPGSTRMLRVRNLEDASRLSDVISTSGDGGPDPLMVLGTGVLGSEIASAARRAGRETLMVGRNSALTLGPLGALISDRLAALHGQHGVDLRLSVGIRSLEPASGGAIDVTLGDGAVQRVKAVVAAVGGDPVTSWLANSGLRIDDGIVCDSSGRVFAGCNDSPVPDVYAVGDVARWKDPETGVPMRVEHQTNAIEQAVAVAHTILRRTALPAPVPYFWSNVHGVRIQALGTFGPQARLEPLEVEDSGDVVQARNVKDATPTGIVGWGAPGAFRRARSLIIASHTRAPTIL